MPRYEFYCEDCNKPFEVILTVEEYEKGQIKCPTCSKKHVPGSCRLFCRNLQEKLKAPAFICLSPQAGRSALDRSAQFAASLRFPFLLPCSAAFHGSRFVFS
jgi:putative FmdB family regulatory protein